MAIHPAWTSPYPVSRIVRMCLLLALAPIAGCKQTTGDFGRPAHGFIQDQVLPLSGTFSARWRGEAASFYALTEDEKELRARAWRFLNPDPNAPVLAGLEAQLAFDKVLPAREPDLTLFHRSLLGGPQFGSSVGDSPRLRAVFNANAFRSLTSRYNYAKDAILADHALVPYFRQIAGQVRQADHVRIRALDHAAHLSAEQREEAIQRVCENARIIARVHWAFVDRAAQYRYSLEHLLVEGPEREAIPAERALMAFETDIAAFQKEDLTSASCAEPVETPPRIAARPLVRKG